MFIGVGAYDSYEDGAMSQSVPPASDVNSIRSRAVSILIFENCKLDFRFLLASCPFLH
jgi:hypothetical protein